ncbi:hypothetical protein L596_001677 [Steinernema carpocapsae]|uniref:Gustatory receptor n=1 Tax=Steinernema carpocapsae TaxID=34508 RepID=A0A4U8ULR9_STECR|nr:hypothetical protein L596_001677 [Steinernema carpocapsae]
MEKEAKDGEKQLQGKDIVVAERRGSGPGSTLNEEDRRGGVGGVTFCNYTGGHLPRKDLNPVCFYIRLTVLLTVTVLASYQVGFVFFHIISSAEYNASTASTLVLLNWDFQALLSVYFLIYWQRKNYLTDIFKLIHIPSGSVGCQKTKHCIRIVFWVFITITGTVLGLFMLQMSMLLLDKHHYLLFDLSVLNVYGNRNLMFLSMVVSCYTFIFWSVAMLIFMSVTIAVYGELWYFNEHLKKLGEDPEKTKDIGDELLHFYRTHCRLSDVVRALDNTFEVYTFAMIGSNIPTTIFTLLALFVSLKVSWMNITFAVPSVVCCLLSLIGLTVIPAKVHSAISEVEKIIYSNKAIWIPYVEKVCSHASSFGLWF